MSRYFASIAVASCLMGLAIASVIPFKDFGQKPAANPASSSSSSVRTGEEYRLPRHILPSFYNIKLLPFIEVGNFTTHGEVQIHATCVEALDSITLHIADIDLDYTSILVEELHKNQQRVLNVANVTEDKVYEKLTIQLGEQLVIGQEYVISMKFVSFLNDELRGFYRSSYTEDGVTKYLAVSHFESTSARRAFPCFDEPNMKANFSITLGRKESMTSASNMPLNKTIPIDELPGYVWDVYETSLTMSTYLVVFLVSDFKSVPSDPEISNVEFNIWSRAAVQNQTDYARVKGPEVLEFFESYFDIPFPLEKMDMAAIPDFQAGAMENWGLITYREEFLLFDEKKSSAANKQRVVEVIAHELGHQWFGNLVTIDWWNVIWLNEGFARYVQYLGADDVEPTFQMNDQFVLTVVQKVFATDALESSRPMNVEVYSPSEIDQIFDTISYDKGASVIRMLANVLGTDTFQRGLTRYLSAKAYSNAVQDDLWNALEEQAAEDGVTGLPASVKEIMDTWTLKKNYPLITVTRDYGGSDGAKITQDRFLLRKESNQTDNSTIYQWWVPLTYTADFGGNLKTVWMSDKVHEHHLSSLEIATDDWIIFNVDQVGYYRVKYDVTNYNLILNQLLVDHTKIRLTNRAQLIDDAMNIARANLLPYSIALDMTQYLVNERDYVPWHASLNALSYLHNMLNSSEAFGNWAVYMSRLIDPLYETVKFEESSTDLLLVLYVREDAIDWACKLGNVDCIDKSKKAYAEWMKDPITKDLSPNQKRAISCSAIANGGEPEWQFAYDSYLATEVINEKTALLSAMGCTKDPVLLSKMLEMMIDPESGIRSQNGRSVFEAVSANPVGNRIAFEFFRDRFDEINAYFYGVFSMGSFFKIVSANYNTQSQLDELMALRDAHLDVLGGSAAVDQAIEVVEGNIEWMSLHYQEVAKWVMPEVSGSSRTQSYSAAVFLFFATQLFGRWFFQ